MTENTSTSITDSPKPAQKRRARKATPAQTVNAARDFESAVPLETTLETAVDLETIGRAVLFLLKQSVIQNPDGTRESKRHRHAILAMLGEPAEGLPTSQTTTIHVNEPPAAPAAPPVAPPAMPTNGLIPAALATPISSRFRRG